MNKKDYVTFETAKLLKEAGFSEKTKHGYTDDGLFIEYSADYPAPHLWHAMKWLREEKRISVEVTCIYGTEYCVDVYVITDVFCDEATLIKGDAPFTPTYEAACDAGIAAACEWIIARKGNKNGTLTRNPSENPQNKAKTE